jgi:hypothetical protein
MTPTRMSRSSCAAAGALAAAMVALAAPRALADYHVPASQAGTVRSSGDGQCSLWEAIDSINNDQVGEGSGLHGCVNVFGGNGIEVEGNGAHYKSGGAVILKPMSIYAYDPDMFAYLEHSGPFVLKVATTPAMGQVYIYGFFIQRTGSAKGRIIENTGDLYLDGVSIVNGDVSGRSGPDGNGGGILNNGGTLFVYDSTIRNNKAELGGGVWSTGLDGVHLEKTTVSTNTAQKDGGGVYSTGRFYAVQSTISDNTALRNGGGAFVTTGDNAYCDLNWSTVAFNRAAAGGGVFVTVPETITIASIVASNRRPNGTLDDYSGDPHGQELGPGDPGVTNVFSTSLGIQNLPKIANDKIADPRLLPLGYYDGGHLKTRAIPTSSPSPALDAIPAQYCGPGGQEQDQNFNPRPARAACDIGAVERP